MQEKRHFEANVWILIERAPDVPGEWVATCPDFDVVSQGTSIKHAFKMVQEAVSMVVVDDLMRGADPHQRRAPKEIWDGLWSLIDRSEKRPPGETFPEHDGKIGAFIAQLNVHVLQVKLGASKPKQPRGAAQLADLPDIPLALAVYEQQASH